MTVGYKHTEIGLVPENWELMPLGEFLYFQNGVNAPKSAYGKGTPFVNVLEVITHTHIHAEHILGRVTLAKSIVDSYSLNRGDLVFNRTSETQEEVGLASVYADDEEAVFGGFVIRGRPKTDLLDAIFSGYAFRAPVIRQQIISRGQGAIRANIGQADLRQVCAALPPRGEQQAIGAALNDADELIASLEKLIAKKRDIKQAAMQQLLTSKQRLPGFSEKWEMRQLGDVGVFRGGNGFPTRYQGAMEGGHPFFKVSDMSNDGNAMFMVNSNNWVSDNVRKAIGATVFPSHSIVFAKIGAAIFLERKKILPRASCIDNNMMGFIPDVRRVHDLFIYYLFLSIRLGKLVSTTALPSLNGNQIAKLEFSIPPLDEQIAIATVISDMDAEITALEQRRDKTCVIKQGMMQELLTGKTRLV